MVTRKKGTPKKQAASIEGAGSFLSTVSGPSNAEPPNSLGSKETPSSELLQKVAAGQDLAAKMTHNPNKPGEYGEAAPMPESGASVEPGTDSATASTATEINPSPKVGHGKPPIGFNPTIGPLDRVRVDSGSQRLTTNQGVPVADNHISEGVACSGQQAK